MNNAPKEVLTIEQKYEKLKQQRYDAIARYREKNKDKLLAIQKENYTKNRDKILEARKAVYAKQKDDEAFKQMCRERSKKTYYKKKDAKMTEEFMNLVNEVLEDQAVDV